MALAHLCSSLQRFRFGNVFGHFHFTALIVDHKSRDGSSQEAENTRIRVQRMGEDSLLYLSL